MKSKPKMKSGKISKLTYKVEQLASFLKPLKDAVVTKIFPQFDHYKEDIKRQQNLLSFFRQK